MENERLLALTPSILSWFFPSVYYRVRLSVLREFAFLDTNNWVLSWEDNSGFSTWNASMLFAVCSKHGISLVTVSLRLEWLVSPELSLVPGELFSPKGWVEHLGLKSLILNFRSRKGNFKKNFDSQQLQDANFERFFFLKVARKKGGNFFFHVITKVNAGYFPNWATHR